jgi:hypothetical protein
MSPRYKDAARHCGKYWLYSKHRCKAIKISLLPLTSTAQMALLWCGVNLTVFEEGQSRRLIVGVAT